MIKFIFRPRRAPSSLANGHGTVTLVLHYLELSQTLFHHGRWLARGMEKKT